MKNQCKGKILAYLLAGAMTVTGLPVNIMQTARVEAAANTALASFDFNAEAADGIFAGGNAKAEVQGGAKISLLAGSDSALYLNGTNAYLNLKKTDGSSLLTGKEEITISYDAKPESGSKSWTFFAAPNADKQSYPNEHYLGVMHTTGGMTVQRFNNSGARPGNDIKTTFGKDWMHVDVVYASGKSQLYVNGEMKGESNSTYKLSDILGSSSVVQLGKANWDDGEFFKGYIDNFKIYDGVLSSEDLAAEYTAFQAAQEEIQKAEAEKNNPLQKDYDALQIVDADDVRGNLPLMKQGKNGSVIEWTSSNPAVISDSAESGIYDGGIVTRPEAGSSAVKVTLTANISLNGESKEKVFEVTVQPKVANLDTDYTGGYLWANFGTEGGYEKIFFGYSTDGLTWNKINKLDGTAQPILANDAEGSDLGVRDPHLIRSAEGDKYWIIGTDLHAEGGGAGGSGWNQLSASQNLIVWESTDLVNWSEPRLVYAGFENAGCVWAPEAIYDETTGDYVVYWSARDNSKAGTDQNALRVYVCRTRDFNTFTEPKVWLSEDQDSGSEVNIIDTTIVKDNGKFYRFSTSDWNTVIDVSQTLDTEDVFDVRTDTQKSSPNGSWTRLVSRSGSAAAGFDGREGFTVYKLPDGKWCAMGDHSGYKAFVTSDLSSGKFTEATASFPDGAFRHGTVVRLSKTEEAAVLNAFANRETPGLEEETAQEPVLEYNFEQDLDKTTMTDSATGNASKDHGTIFGNAKVVYDEERKSNVLTLDGSTGAYAELPKGFFDKRNTMTISMDVKSQMSSGNFFTFTYGKDFTVYDFLRIRGSEVRNAVTINSYGEEKEVKGTGAATGEWQKVVIVIDGTTMKLYLDGTLVSTNTDVGFTTSALGTDLVSYLGKSMYSTDGYFKGSFDNIQVYNRVLSDAEILNDVLNTVSLLKNATIGTVVADPSAATGTDDHTAITTSINKTTKEITSYIRKTADLKNVPLTLSFVTPDVTATMDGKAFTNGSTVDLSKDAALVVKLGDRTETYTLKTPKIAYNPILPGQYADPDIDYFDGKYWIYPTTDGVSGWGGTVFHAWSSENLRDWNDEGIILDVKEKNPGTNSKGVQIAASKWSDGNAWAPSIEKKNGKYYFYYCGNINSSYTGTCGSGKAIGVAVADNPAGPYVAQELPIVYPKMMSDANIGFSGQVIDPSIFTDDDGTSYLFFGNGGSGSTMVELNDDMVTAKTSTLKRVTGLTDFRESVVVTKRNGIYHFTWSCDDTGSPNYHVNYGTADKLDGNVTFKYTLLQKDEAGSMLGTAHQSVLYMPETDKCYIAYHRFYTPLGIYTSGLGYHRETCIDEITFDSNGRMQKVSPTMNGVYVNPSDNPSDPSDNTDKTALLSAITAAETKVQKDYTADSWKKFAEALSTAKAVSEKADAKQSEIDEAATALTAAIKNLVKTPAPVKKKFVTSITATPSGKTLNVGQSFDISVKVLPVDAENKAVTYTSKNPSIASVSSTGTVKAKKSGTTSIIVKAKDGSGITATVKVTVRKGSLSVSGAKTITLKLNNKKKKDVTLKASAKNLTGKITWKVTKGSKYIKLSKKTGTKVKITARKAGTATLSISCGGKTVKKMIKVKKK